MMTRMHRCARLICGLSIKKSWDHSSVRTWLLALTPELEPWHRWDLQGGPAFVGP